MEARSGRAALACALLAWGCDDPVEVTPPGSSLRVLTYNVGFVADGHDYSDGTLEDDEARAEEIAADLIAGEADHDADVIILEEAFDEDAQNIFSRELCADWPYHVEFLDEPGDDQHQDSGLMLFSRHPFAGLSLNDPGVIAEDVLAFTGCVGDDADEDDPLFWGDIGYLKYENCANIFEDCYANKGAGLARFTHTGTGEAFNVVFTHTQADNDEAETRGHQFDNIQQIVEAIPDWKTTRTFIAGDLNVEGLGCNAAGCPAGGDWTGEWQDLFGSSQSFFGCGAGPCGPDAWFVDSQAFDMPASWLGRTHPGQRTLVVTPPGEGPAGSRYDYVLHNVPLQLAVCTQQTRVLSRLATDVNGTPLSDHDPLLADFHSAGVGCNPLAAAVVDHSASNVASLGGAIHEPKAMQWFRIDQPGTYRIDATDPTTVDVYTADDLSYPIGDDGGEPDDRGLRYRLPHPPYFLRVTGPPSFTGGYTLSVIKSLCSVDEPCGLTPGDTAGTDASWDSASVIGSSSRWFYFHTDVTNWGASPEVEIRVSGECSSPFEAILRDPSGAVVDWTEVVPSNLPTEVVARANTLGAGEYTVEVHRTDDAGTAPCAMNVQYTTDLTYFLPGDLRVVDETGGSGGPAEEIGHDEIWYRFVADDGCVSSSDPEDFAQLGAFDEDDSTPLKLRDAIGVQRYTDCFAWDLLEEDDIDDEDVTFLDPRLVSSALQVDLNALAVSFTWGGEDDDYEYVGTYILSHEPDPH